MVVSRRLMISGRVQGVGFRWFALEQARVEGLTGFVWNLPDGRVEVLVEGDAESVERFERAVRRGPRGARVDDCEVEPVQPAGHREFSIRN
ncbi:MAG TPA: acylphosphatase [Vicinamibacterales bacterium]|jgi:acylphosphatase|nr:acylphosphatase [Vicinamibacterales bacterium]